VATGGGRRGVRAGVSREGDRQAGASTRGREGGGGQEGVLRDEEMGLASRGVGGDAGSDRRGVQAWRRW